jgi:hypothetical protein
VNFARNFSRGKTVRIVISSKALEAVFDECDRYNIDETGGRLIGTFSEVGNELIVNVSGVIESGPQARRSNTSFFQDGEYQESVFRQIEASHPEIEHLGNWHTHHVNGYATLSGGDVQTYQRIVNHAQHNTSFFYALLVTDKLAPRSKERYHIKHYVLRRGDAQVYEINQRDVQLTDGPIMWPRNEASEINETARAHRLVSASTDQASSSALTQRAYDGAVLRDFYEQLRTFTSPKIGIYWRGPIELSDGSSTQVLVVEDASDAKSPYSVGLLDPGERFKILAGHLEERRFPSARAALIYTERACNRTLFALATLINTARN